MPEIYEFANFRLNENERLLVDAGSGERIALADKAFDTLCVLVANAGRLVPKEELLTNVWAGTFVEENNLNKSIYAIRRALGEKNGDQKYIETVKRHGFRFVADVRKSPSPLQPVLHETSMASDENDHPRPLSTVREFPRIATFANSGPAAAVAFRPRTQPRVPDQDDSTARESHTSDTASRRRRNVYLSMAAVLLLLTAGVITYKFAVSRAEGAPGTAGTLAVLPLKPLDRSDDYLGFGMADAIIQRISRTGTVTVRPTSSIRRYLNEDVDTLTAARALGVDSVLEGTVQRSDGRLRVSVNLLRVSDGRSLWTDNFDMQASEAFAIQDNVAQKVAANLKLRLDPAQSGRLSAPLHTPNATAYEYYLKGIYSFDQRGYSVANKAQNEATIALFKKAVETDPEFAAAHARLAYAYAWMAVYVDADAQGEWVKITNEEITRADALDPQLAETHLAKHHILLSASEGFQLEAATGEALIARQIDPSVGIPDLAADFLHLGLEDQFEREKQRSLTVDPTGEFNKNLFGILYSNARRYDDWLANRQTYFDGRPDAQYLMGTGRLDEAQQQIEASLAKKPDDQWALGNRAILFALKGDRRGSERDIRAIIAVLNRNFREYHHHTYDIACAYAVMGNSSEAVKWLRETAASGFPSYPLFERDHYLDNVRQTPEFGQFMTEMSSRHDAVRSEFTQ